MKHTNDRNVTLVLKSTLVANPTVAYYATVEAARAAALARMGFDSAVVYDENNRVAFRARRWYGKAVN